MHYMFTVHRLLCADQFGWTSLIWEQKSNGVSSRYRLCKNGWKQTKHFNIRLTNIVMFFISFSFFFCSCTLRYMYRVCTQFYVINTFPNIIFKWYIRDIFKSMYFVSPFLTEYFRFSFFFLFKQEKNCWFWIFW